ncbi:nSTAND1 domain-containing NTPase [Archangium lansingense]|uniref:Novel STAND NTPase 1 domain-containing protein n=1 Tax=Archangium lansingense TaxID=2995310 RepID=A0ABT3ZZ44_9BACT|nr:hypothetical protein [Archangium lansinium]MCY1074314.1 hypothetical protein [Archangium lansinium]
MDGSHKRYPGAPPFEDDETSRKVFFGRERESCVLSDQIITNRLVVVYARSGAGKTSLLKAGVAQHLRDEGFLPLFIRVNVVGRKPLELINESIGREAARQGIEYVPGRMDSLWLFVKTAELWRGDFLLTPVLIFDQFEEFFTLQPPEFRKELLEGLGALVRGVRPSAAQGSGGAREVPGARQDITDSPPAARVVLSLREDFLGFLEEAADVLPQILSQRFRLVPLSEAAAMRAFQEPSRVDDAAFATRPFDIPSETVEQVLKILSRRGPSHVQQAQSRTTIELFQLQLLCQHIEELAARRQAGGADRVAVTLQDLGGESGLQSILSDFYVRVLNLIPSIQSRSAARSLCERALISPTGRRLSLEESEIERRFHLSVETLRILTQQRLLRAEPHADSVYYELSHDSLIEPILAKRQYRRELLAKVGGVLGAVLYIAIVSRSLWKDRRKGR